MTRPTKTDTPRKPAPRKPAPRKPGTTAPEPAASTGAERIAKVMARSGLASRRDAERMIAEGRVTVNGKVIASPALDVTPKDRILVDGVPLAAPEPPRVWLYHKPEGLVTTARDEQGRPTVFDHLPEDLPRVMTIGRLDLNSEGLLLLTNDGALKRRLELPSTGWLRKYRVRVNGRPEDSTFDPLRKGIVIEGEAFQPMTVTLDRQQGANAWLTVGLREGRNREVRRAMEAVGLSVNRLIRVSYGPFQLGDLKPGEVAEVRPRMLKDQLGLAETPMPRPEARSAAARPQRRAAAGGEGGALGPAAGAGRAAAAPRARPGGAKPQTGRTKDEATARAASPRPTAAGKPAGRKLAESAAKWLDRQERPAAGDRARDTGADRAKAPKPPGGLSRGGARPEALAEPGRNGPAARQPATKAPRPGGRGKAGGGATPAPKGPKGGGRKG